MDTTTLLLEDFCLQQQLPPEYIPMAKQWFLPLANDIAKQHQQKNAPLLIGINGCQGSGKSTLSFLLKTLLKAQHQKSVTVLSIDDFYLTKKERQTLARDSHPLFITRGVPGTHDIAMLTEVIIQLQSDTQETWIPRFNKANDDRHNKQQWDKVSAPVDIILLEGWCVASPAQPEHLLRTPINTLEQDEDIDGQWRSISNTLLKNEYKTLFDALDTVIMLKAPSFNCVYQWRQLQEDKLRKAHQEKSTSSQHIMDTAQLKRFIEHYQRITEHTLNTLSHTADIVFTLNSDHQIVQRHSQHAS